MSNADWIAVAAAAIALVSALVSAYYSWRANRIAVLQHRRSEAPIVFDYGDYRAARRTEDLLIGFLIGAVNQSDVDNSLVSSVLSVSYKVGGIENVASVWPYEGEDVPHWDAAPRLLVPSRIDGRQAVRGWVYFSISGHLLHRTSDFESYTLLLADSSGRTAQLKPTMVRTR